MTQPIPTYLTSEEVAVLLHCNCRSIEDLLRSGDLPGFKIGHHWLLPADTLHQCLNQMALDGAEERRKAREVAMRPRATLLAASERKKGRVRPDLTGLL